MPTRTPNRAAPRPQHPVLPLLLLATITIASPAGAQHQHPGRFRRYKWNGEVAFATLLLAGSAADIMTVQPSSSTSSSKAPAAVATPRALITGGFNAHPAYSSDGSTIAFSGIRPASPVWEVYVAGASDGSNPRPITASPANGYSMVPDWSCDDSKIAFEGVRAGDALSQAYVINADGTGPATRIWPQPGEEQVGPKFSPNCKQLAFASTAGGAKDLYLVNVRVDRQTNAYSFTNLRRLTQGMHNDFSRSWSSDSKQIVFNAQMNGVGQLYVITVRTGKLRQLTYNPGLFPAFSPGGVFPDFRGDVTPKWSPDGKSVAFCRQMAMFPGDTQGTYQVYIVPLKGRGKGEPYPLTNLSSQSLSIGWRRVAVKTK